MRPRPLLVLLLSLFTTVSPARAQDAPRVRGGGFWYSAGLGGARVDLDCGGCDALPDSIPYRAGGGGQGFVAAGTALAPNLRVGGQLLAAFRERGRRDATLLHLAALALYHPVARGPLFLRAGLGVNGSTLAGGGTLIESTGVSANLDVGYELWRWGAHTFAPYAGATLGSNRASSGSVSDDGRLELEPPRKPRAFYLGLNVAAY